MSIFYSSAGKCSNCCHFTMSIAGMNYVPADAQPMEASKPGLCFQRN